MPPELAPDYYRINFETLLDFVAAQYDGLLTPAEKAFYQTYQRASRSARSLYVRLLMRKGLYFRLEKLTYTEIPCIQSAAAELQALDLLALNTCPPGTEWTRLFTKAELLSVLSDQSLSALKKSEIEAHITNKVDATALIEQLCEQNTLIQLKSSEHFCVFQLLFFGNGYQDLKEFVLSDLGLYQYEDYPICQETLPFKSRKQLEAHLAYYHLLELHALCQSKDDLLQLANRVPTCHIKDDNLARRLNRLRVGIARDLERSEAWHEALTLYEQCDRHPARERAARVHFKLNQQDFGFAVCESIVHHPDCQEELEFARSFAHRMAKKYAPSLLTHWPKAKRRQPKEETVVLLPGDRVERLAQAHLASDGDCYYVENALVCGMLGLYIWDIIFAPMQGVFFNPFQSAPDDFRTSAFVSTRQPLLDERLNNLNQACLRQRVLQTWHGKFGRQNPLVHWGRLSEALLLKSVERIPAEHWLSLFKKLLSDISSFRAGLPDLVFFPFIGGYEFIEIKGPGDKLQKNQLRWMAHFAEENIPHKVMHIQYPARDMSHEETASKTLAQP